MDTFLIGISGKARSGKTTLAQYIHELDPVNTKIYYLADALKSFCRIMGWMSSKDGKILQMVGTDLMRRVDPMIWVRTLEEQIKEDNYRYAIIGDCRFDDEFQWCRDNGITVRISKIGFDGQPIIADDRPANHPSETALDNHKFDFQYFGKIADYIGIRNFASAVTISAKLRRKITKEQYI